MIKLENVSLGYSKDVVLDNINLSFKEGKITSIIGPNGSGKSTLLKSILKLIKFISGEIEVDEINISNLKRKEIAKVVSYLPQHKIQSQMSVFQMVLHGRYPHTNIFGAYSKEDIEIANKYINELGLVEFKDSSLNTLSGGIIQKVYIAMALAQDTKYIILDEPTTFLDIKNQLNLMNILKKLSQKGKGIIIVMHDLPICLNYSDEIVVLNDKLVVYSGAVDELYSNGLLKNIYNIELKKNKDGIKYKFD